MKANDKGHILVVDDEETMRRSLADILRLEGYRVQAVASGEAALEAIKRETYDLILLDLKMPGMDGLEVLHTLTNVAPDIKVILLTAHGSLESAIEALRHEAYDYLLKPSSPNQIVNSVVGALRLRAEDQHKRQLLEQLDSSLKALREVEKRDAAGYWDHQTIQLGNGVLVDFSRREMWKSSTIDHSGKVKKVFLTPTEGKLLKVLLENRGLVMKHRDLVAKVQGYEVTDWEAPEVLRPLVSRLRQKLSVFPGGEKWVRNVRGTGYVFEQDIK